jgi:tetratricopeptide (TPR) repeat protein/2-polyprenyl-3-methyl-5-hydroxy-6-metoxy-1,4-benzoquinol methylase
MTRKLRLIGAHQGRRLPGPSERIAALLAAAQRYHQAGQLAEAERGYRKILAADRKHIGRADLLGIIANNLGNVLKQQGKLDDAAVQYRKALALNPEFAEAHNNLGNALKNQGKLEEAIAHYERAVTLKPDYAVAQYNLGNACKEQGKLHDAGVHYRQALAIDPNYAPAHNNLGNVLKEQEKLDEAVSHYRHALAINPNFAEAHNNLGNALKGQGKLGEAKAQYQRALALRPNFADAHNNLAIALAEQGNLDAASAEYRRALNLKPDYAEAHNNLGTVLHEQGKIDEAVVQYRRALALNPNYAEAHANLGKALMEQGDHVPALNAIQRSVEIQETQNAKTLFIQAVRALNFIPPGVDLRKNLIRALSEPWGRPIDVAKFSATLLKQSGATGACINRVASAWPKRLTQQEMFTPGEFPEVCDDELLRCLLKSTFICDIELERFLTATRFALLGMTSAGVNALHLGEDGLRFCCALAHQCFINEYIFGYTDDEIERAQRLRAQIVEALVSENSVPELWLVIVAMYFSLSSLPVAQLILDRSWSAPLAALVLRQVREPLEEQQLQPSIQCLTQVEDSVSRTVQQQYEENPYPRWMMTAPVPTATTIDGYLRRRFPLTPFRRMAKRAIEILIAGCGTGQHSIETAQQFIAAQVLAIDLSLASLCYAKRRTRELELSNIDYAQADILDLASIGRDFDVIDASGVLHHLADPLGGWRLLLSMLRPGGFMRVGLYSKLARRNIVDVRNIIAQGGYRASTEDIRLCRQVLASSGDDTPARRVAEMSDFFSMSTCRDLVFHVQEHQFTLPEISTFLNQNRLQLLGFEMHGQVLQSYRRRFPEDQTMTDLNRWHIFEAANPAIFAGMYQFWIQKT